MQRGLGFESLELFHDLFPKGRQRRFHTKHSESYAFLPTLEIPLKPAFFFVCTAFLLMSSLTQRAMKMLWLSFLTVTRHPPLCPAHFCHIHGFHPIHHIRDDGFPQKIRSVRLEEEGEEGLVSLSSLGVTCLRLR